MEGGAIRGAFGLFLILAFAVVFASAFSTTSNLSTRGLGISEISTNWSFSGSESVRLYAPNITDFVNSSNWHEARINISFDTPLLLINFENMSWQANVIQGYLPHADVFLDNGEVLVFEYAKVDPLDCDNSTNYATGNFSTFNDKGILTNSSYAWLNSNVPGPCGDPGFNSTYKSLSEWKLNYSNANILKIQIKKLILLGIV